MQPIELERVVQGRTNHRVQNLCVELLPDLIILKGETDSYYVKQLAQEGVRELVPGVRLFNRIAVVAPTRHPFAAAAS